MKLIDTNHPFFRPLWIRIIVVALATGWGIFEFTTGSVFWGIISFGFAGLAFWGFFVDFNPDSAA